jgi:hypothetical protein
MCRQFLIVAAVFPRKRATRISKLLQADERGALYFGNLDVDTNERGDRKTLRRNAFANWRGAHSAQHAFSHPIIAILGRALVDRAWKTRSMPNDRAPKFNTFWIQGALGAP